MRHLAVVFFHKLKTESQNVFGLVVIQADGFNMFFDFIQAKSRHFGGSIGYFEKLFGRFVDAFVGTLRGEDNCYQQCKRIVIFQFASRIRVGSLKYV